ncbi:LysR substrate-binding domain-containing protein [Trinickia acidisoli]|uniref:LysR substrate-binding domain-containing protein n=1 Tax=Trinickia acidisoli TaxID=2767482 RepID=UPI001A906C29|nr:LysR substrate-binding domain-containing protein [Trinickia acidisoli]
MTKERSGHVMDHLNRYMTTNMNARHLRLLVAIEDSRNLTQVASSLFVTVPAVSKTLSEIERTAGVRIFERTSHGLRPTIYGECFVRHARAVLTELNQTATDIKALKSGNAGRVRVGITRTFTSTIMPKALALLKQGSPHVGVSIYEGRMTTLLEQLLRGEVDLIVGRLPNKSDRAGLQEKVLLDLPIKLVTGRHHPLATQEKLAWSDLEGFPWILPPAESLMRQSLENTFAYYGLPLPQNYIETRSSHLIRAYIQLNDAIAPLTVDASKKFGSLDPVHVLPLDLRCMRRPLGVVWRTEKQLEPGALLLLRSLESSVSGDEID